MDWLVHTLMTDVESHYWNLSQMKSWGFRYNTGLNKEVTEAVIAAKAMKKEQLLPNSSCVIVQSSSPTQQDVFYAVTDANTDDAVCTCEAGLQGRFCKHRARCLMQLHGWDEEEVRKYFVEYAEPGKS